MRVPGITVDLYQVLQATSSITRGARNYRHPTYPPIYPQTHSGLPMNTIQERFTSRTEENVVEFADTYDLEEGSAGVGA